MNSVKPKWILLGLLSIHTFILGYSASVRFPVIDEMGHMAAGVRHWQTGDFSWFRVNPPFVRMVATAPVVLFGPEWNVDVELSANVARPEFQVGAQFIEEHGRESVKYFAWARWSCIPFSLLGVVVCYLWARDLFGVTAGLFAATVWCFDPTVLATGALITPDLAAASTGLLASYCFFKWSQHPSWRLAILCGCTLGIAELTKTSWIVLYLLWPCFFAISCLDLKIRRFDRSKLRLVPQLVATLFLSLYLLNMGYGFQGSLTPVGDFSFRSKSLSGVESPNGSTPRANRFEDSWLENVPSPFPWDYVLGVDYIKWEFERGYPSYLAGVWKHGGWWYYYIYALLVKCPVGHWCLFVCSLFVGWCSFRSRSLAAIQLLAPAVVLLCLVSSQTGFNHHLRYALPSLPFVFIWCSQCIETQNAIGRHVVRWAICYSVLSSLFCFPHHMSYFNELAGGPLSGASQVGDSNVDWGQDIDYFLSWLEENPEIDSIGTSLYQWVDVQRLGVDSFGINHWPSRLTGPGRQVVDEDGTTTLPLPTETGPLPGWYAVSRNLLNGNYWECISEWGKSNSAFEKDPSLRYLRNFDEEDSVGYTVAIYHISLEEANSLRRRLKLPDVTHDFRRLKIVSEQVYGPPNAEASIGPRSNVTPKQISR